MTLAIYFSVVLGKIRHHAITVKAATCAETSLMFCKMHVLSRVSVRRADIGSSSGTGDSCQTNNAGAAAPAAPDGHSRFDCSLTEHALPWLALIAYKPVNIRCMPAASFLTVSIRPPDSTGGQCGAV